MADKTDEKETAKKGGMTGILIPLVGGGIGVFILSIPVALFTQGMVQFGLPHMKPAERYVLADSVLAQHYIEEGLLSEEGLAAVAAKAAELEAQAARESEAEQARLAKEKEDAAAAEAARTAETAKAAAEPAKEETPSHPAPEPGKIAAAQSEKLPFDRERLARLVKVYEKMKPKQVAMILGTMPDSKSAMILATMKDKSAAAVLAAIDPPKAARLSELIVRMTSLEP